VILFSLALALFAGAPAQLPEDPGEYQAGWRLASFTDANYGAGTVTARVHYPATSATRDAAPDLSGAPYQQVVLMHGWLGSASGLDHMANHMASHGYLVVNLDTEKGLFPDIPAYAVDARAGLQWLEDRSGNPASWLYGMGLVGDWAAIGHSMGGGALSHLIGIEPRVRAILGMQAAESPAPGPANMTSFEGAGLWIGGSVDTIVPPSTVRQWYTRAGDASRRMYFEVQGMGHLGCLDNPPNDEPMPGAEQQRVHRRMLIAFLDAEMRDEHAAYEYLVADVGGGAAWTYEQSCPDPLLWGGASIQSNQGLFGVHGTAGAQTVFAWSTQTGATQTPFGVSGLDLAVGGRTQPLALGSEGYGKSPFRFPTAWSGNTVYFQAAVYSGPGQGALTQLLSIFVP
jgi:dienelactone hydrolase